MTFLSNFIVVYTGLLALAITMPKQRSLLFPHIQTLTSRTELILTLSGWMTLLANLIVVTNQHNIGVGFTLWFGLISAAAMLLSITLVYQRKIALGLLLFTPVIALHLSPLYYALPVVIIVLTIVTLSLQSRLTTPKS